MKKNLLLLRLLAMISAILAIQLCKAQSIQYDFSFDLSAAFSFQNSFQTSAQEGNPLGIAFSADGTKLFVIGSSGRAVNQYSLAEAFDISTTLHDGQFSVFSQEPTPRDLAFNPTGTKLYVLGNNRQVYQYTLATAFDVTSGVTYDGSPFSVASQESAPRGMAFSNDGLKLFVTGSTGDDVNQYALNSSFDVTAGGTLEGTPFDVSSEDTSPQDVTFNDDGTKMYLTGFGTVYEYDLSTAFDITSGASYSGSSVDLSNETSLTSGMKWNNDGSKLFAVDFNSDRIYQYELPIGNFNESEANVGEVDGALPIRLEGDQFNNAGSNLVEGTHFTLPNKPAGLSSSIAVDADGLNASLTFTGSANDHQLTHSINDLTLNFLDAAFQTGPASAITNATSASTGVSIDFRDNNPALSYGSAFELTHATLSGTSGLTGNNHPDFEFDDDGDRMFILFTDRRIYEMLPANPYDITGGFTFGSTNLNLSNDDTGVSAFTFNGDGTKLFVVGATNDAVFQYILSTGFDLSTASLDGSFDISGQEGNPNSIAFNADGSKLFIYGLDSDQIHQYSLSTNFEITSGATYDHVTLDLEFTDSFMRDIAFANGGAKLFTLGDSNDEVYEFDLSTNFDLSTADRVGSLDVSDQQFGFAVSGPRALYLTPDGGTLIILNNSQTDFSQYDLGAGGFDEVVANDGAVSGNLVIYIEDETFTNAGGSLIESTDYSISNLPSGLTPNLTIAADARSATLTLSGNANDHQASNTISSLNFTFENSAFTTVNASRVSQSVAFASGISVDFNDNNAALTYGIVFDASNGLQQTGSLDISDEESTALAITFNDDGSKAYIAGTSNRTVYEYDLAENFNFRSQVSLASSFDISNEELVPYDITFNDDGSKFYLIGTNSDAVHQYNVPTAYDLSSGLTLEGSFSVSGFEAFPYTMTFNDDGSKWYMVGISGEDIHQFSLATPYDLTSSVSLDGPTVKVTSQTTTPTGLAFSKDGFYLNVLGQNDREVYRYKLSIPFDITSGLTLESTTDLADFITNGAGFSFSTQGDRLFILDNSQDQIVQLQLEVGGFVEVPANTGNVSGSLVISVEDEVFTNAGGTFTVGSEYSVTGIPTGFTPILNVSADGKTATLTVSGVATSHQDDQDVEDLTFTFNNSAFVGGNASLVDNTTGASSFIGFDFRDNEPLLTYSSSFDLNEGFEYAGNDFSISSEMAFPTGIAFNTDGTKMFVIDGGTDDIYQYSLSQGFDLSSGVTYDNVSFDVTSEEDSPNGLYFSPDGLKMYVTGSTGDDVNQYNLTNPFDISSGVNFVAAFKTGMAVPEDLEFNTDGSKLYVLDSSNDRIRQYTVATPFDLTNGVFFDGVTVDITSEDSDPRGFAFSEDGKRLYVYGNHSTAFYGYTLTLPFDITSGLTYDGSPLTSGNINVHTEDIVFSTSGHRFFLVSTQADAVQQFDLDIQTFSEVDLNDGEVEGLLTIYITDDAFSNASGSLTHGSDYSINNLPLGLTPQLSVAADGLSANLTFSNNANDHQASDALSSITFDFENSAFVNTNAADVKNAQNHESFISLVFEDNQPALLYGSAYNLDVASVNGSPYGITGLGGIPSGIAFSTDGLTMFILGKTSSNAVRQYSLSTPFDLSGTVTETASFDVSGQDTQPDAITFHPDGSKMYILGLLSDRVHEYSLTVPFDVSSGASFTGSSALLNAQDQQGRGFAFNDDGTKLYVVGSVTDAVYQYNLGTAFDVTSGVTFDNISFDISEFESNAEGIQFSQSGNLMFIIGASSDKVHPFLLDVPFDLSTARRGGPALDISSVQTSPRGMGFSSDGNELFIVGNGGLTVTHYTLGNDGFTESASNDGSMDGVLSIRLLDDFFSNAGSTLISPTDYTIPNLPAGLNPSMTVAPDGLSVTLTLSGNATSHLGTDDISSLQFTFEDHAFVNYNASEVDHAIAASSGTGIDFLENADTDIETFTLNDETGSATINGTTHSVNIEVLFGTDVTNLSPIFTISDGASANPASGASQDFTNPVTYTITAEDGSTVQDWNITVTIAPNTENDITDFSFPEIEGTASIDASNHTVVAAAIAGTDISSISPILTLSENATAAPNSGSQQDFSTQVDYIVTAEDGTTQTWGVTVTETPAAPTDISISVDNMDENLAANTTIGTFSTTDASFNDSHSYSLVGGVGDDDNGSFTISGDELIANFSGDFENQSIYQIRVQTDDNNGGQFQKTLIIQINDLNEGPTDLQLSSLTIDESSNSGTVIGSFSTTDEDTGDSFSYSLVSGTGDADNASFDIIGDELVSAAVFDFETRNSYSIRVQSEDDGGLTISEAYTIQINDLPPQATSITLSPSSVAENEAIGTIIGAFTTQGEDLSGTYTYTLVSGSGDEDNDSFSISGDQLLTAASFNFETDANYSVRVKTDDGNGNTLESAISVSITDVFESTDTNISSFVLTEQTGTATINSSNHTIEIEVIRGTDLSSLTPNITISNGAIVSPSSGISQDFSTPVTYTVTAEDGTTAQDWVVTVSEAPNTETDILSFTLSQQSGNAIIDNGAHSISISVVYGTDMTSLSPVITLSEGATVSPESGTSQDLSTSTTYTVTAEDGTTLQDWSITVTEAPNTATDILSFSLAEETGSATIDATNHAITIEVANGTDLSSLAPTLTLSEGASVDPGNGTAQDFSAAVTYTVTAEDGTTSQDWTINVSEAPSTATDILSFTLAEETGSATIDATNHAITIEVANGTDLSSLAPTLTLSEGASVDPASGTAQDFIASVTYTVTAEDGTTTQDWTINVSEAPSTATDILSFTLAEETGSATIDATNHAITIEVANGTDLSSLTPTLTLSEGASVDPASGTAQDFSAAVPYIVTAEDGTTTQDWTINVSEAPSTATDILAFTLAEETGSAAIDATNHAITIEVANGTDLSSLTPTLTLSEGASVDPASGTAQDFSAAVTYTVTAEDGTTTQDWTINVSEAPSTATDILSFTLAEETGSAAIDATNHAITIEVANGTNLSSLTPTLTLSEGASVDPASGTAQDFSAAVTYTVTAEDGTTTQDWTINVSEAPSTATDILAFTLAEETGSATIDATNHAITIEVANGTNLSSLTPTLTLSEGASVDPASGTAQDFSAAVTYTVTAEDGTTTQDWTINVSEAPSTATDILAFTLAEETGSAAIDATNHAITIEVANGTDLSSLTPTLTLSEGASVDPASGTAQDFSAAVTYTVTAEDGTTTQDWTINVSEAPSTATDILAFTLAEETGSATIDATNHAITIEVANGTDLSSLAPTLTLSEGASVDPASGTAQDFSAAVTYTVTAEDGTTSEDWTINVSEAPSTATDILSFTLAEETGSATIDVTNHAIAIEVANGTDLSSLAPTLTLSEGASVDPASGTAQDFSAAVTYTVTAEDGTTSQDWTINVSEAPSTATDILSFTLAEETGSAAIDATNHTVAIEVKRGTDISSLIPTITVSAGASINPASGISQDFSAPVTYRVTAENGTTQAWLVTVTTELSSATDIISFELTEQTSAAIIDIDAHTVNIEVNFSSDLTALSPQILISEGATITPESQQSMDFSSPVIYTVIAEDSQSQQDWTVIVTKELALSTSQEINLQVYPNPTDHWLNIEQAPINAEISLFNSNGKVLRSILYEGNTKLDLRDLPGGIYHLRIYDPSTAKIHNNKIIKR